MDLIKRFKQDASILMDKLPISLSHWLFTMRHYGISTRLLDWTEDPLVALYFAAVEYFAQDGRFWILQPITNRKDGKFDSEISTELPSFEENTEIMKAYNPESLYQHDRSSLTPVAFISPRENPRMQAQSSVFVIFHRNKIPLEEGGMNEFVWSFVIPKDCKNNILKELKLLRIDKFRLFPELEFIKEKMGDI